MAGPIEIPTLPDKPLKIEIWHNILWSNYKAGVFSEMYRICSEKNIELTIFQIAETDQQRALLTPIDLSFHNYPYVNLFKGLYEAVPLWRRVFALARHAATTDADIVAAAGYHRLEYILQGLIWKLRGKPRAVFCDSTSYDRPRVAYKVLLKRISFGIFRNVFCYGQRACEYVIALGVQPEHAYTRCQAAALPKTYDSTKIVEARRTMRSGPDAPIFVYVGRLADEKQLDVLIRAFGVFVRDHPLARLKLVGSGPIQADLEQLTKDLALCESIEFTGPKAKDALVDAYFEAYAFVLPSWSEPWGLVVNEALHFGCPVIVSHRCGCVPELVEASAVGLVFQAADVGDLAGKMRESIALWREPVAVAEACLSKIKDYTATNAATAIIAGAVKVVNNP